MKKKDLKNYAKLIVKVGGNVQKKQDVVIVAGVNDAYFVKYLVEEAYKAKARSVIVDWRCDEVSRYQYKYESFKTLCEIPEYVLKKLEYRADTLPVMIYIDSSDPDAMKGLDQEKLMKVRKTTGPIIKPIRDKMENKYQWVIAAIPGEAWAKKVFPKETKSNAIKKLWDAIFSCARVNGDPIKNWADHNNYLIEHYTKLNELKLKKLIYKNSIGTDFSVELLPNVRFTGGIETALSGISFNPNMPSEECFTSPNKHSANGTVMASKPLSLMGNVISDFGFTFKDGKVVEVIARNAEEKAALEQYIDIDEGARMLGEVALVPFNSPINETGLLFYNTLFDENACCHLALGLGFEDTIVDFDKLTKEERKAVGLNDSMIHTDFMIGTADLSIVGETIDGKTIQIFKDGVWAF